MAVFNFIGRTVRDIVDPRVGFYYKAVIVAVFSAWYMEYSVLDAFSGFEQTPVIKIETGDIVGRVATTSRLKQKFHSFQGIPYARPPLGDLRFMPPQPANNWTGTLTAFAERNKCYQSGSSEALQNLLPNSIRNPNLPVLVWFHGGAFRIGSADTDLYGADFFMEAKKIKGENVILVAGNYRLGPFGFLSYEEGGVPGNAGLKDQVAILKWVKRNIAAFGGNPDRVTIFGESAGATSVQMHMIAPMSDGLFGGAISESGSALNPRSSTSSERATERARRLAKLVGIQIDGLSDKEIVQKLKAANPKTLATLSEKVLLDDEKRGFEVAPFVPSIERGLTSYEQFLSDTPLNLLTKGRIAPVPYITGINSQESIYLLNKWKTLNYTQVETEFEKLVPADLGIPPRSEASYNFAHKMKEFYFGEKPVSIGTVYNLLNLYSDVFVCLVVHRSINIHVLKTTTDLFVYYFAYDGNLAFTDRILDTGLKGVSHAGELGYLFPIRMLPASPTAQDWKIVDRMIRLWTVFAHSGNPNSAATIADMNVKWPPANKPHSLGVYLEIDSKARLGRSLLSDRMSFWNHYYSLEHGGGPY